MVLRLLISIIIILNLADIVLALDFYGVNVTDEDAPSGFMKYGISGYHPTVSRVYTASQAEIYGFREGDIILSINDKEVRRSSELTRFSTDMLSVMVFSGLERITRTINRLAIETERLNRIEAERLAAASRQRAYFDEGQANAPALKFDDAALERKYGKSTLAPPYNANNLPRRTMQSTMQNISPLKQQPMNVVNSTSNQCEVVLRKSSCSYFVADCLSGYALLEWYGGYDPYKGDIIAGDFTSFGFKDIYYTNMGSEGRVYVDNYWLSKSRAIEKFYGKCN